MDRRLKERLTGAVVLMLLAVIFIPMILDNSAQDDVGIRETNIPPVPDIEFRSAVMPVEDLPPPATAQLPIEPLPVSEVPIADVPTQDNTTTPTIPAVAADSTATLPEPVQQEAVAAPEENRPDVNEVATSTDTANRSLSAWVIQLGSFSSQQNADGLVRRLQTRGFPAYIEPVKAGAQTVYKVRVGPQLSRTEAESVQKNLKSGMNLDAIILRFP